MGRVRCTAAGIALAISSVTSSLEAQERIRSFIFTRNSDPMSGKDRSTLTTQELTPTLLRTAQLYWRCDANDLQLFVFLDDFLNTSDPAPVQWRFDSDTASPFVPWPVSTEGTAAFAPRDLIPLLTSRAKTASKVLFRLLDYKRTPHDVTFQLLGLSAGLGRLPCASHGIDAPVALDTTVHALRIYGSVEPPEAIPVLVWECQAGKQTVAFRLHGRERTLSERVSAVFDNDSTSSDWWSLFMELKPERIRDFNQRVSTASSLAILVAASGFSRKPPVVTRYTFSTANLGSSLAQLTCPQ